MEIKVNFNTIAELVYQHLVESGQLVPFDNMSLYLRIGQLKFDADGLNPEDSTINIIVSTSDN